ncbi:hypothetical protein J6590_078297 [Homalodisca vitripennis]|nr:hypothetical protein J6590_078297 [Homalodisca vitripennis]
MMGTEFNSQDYMAVNITASFGAVGDLEPKTQVVIDVAGTDKRHGYSDDKSKLPLAEQLKNEAKFVGQKAKSHMSSNAPPPHNEKTEGKGRVSVLVVTAQRFISHNAPAVPRGSGSCVATSRRPVHSIGRRQLHSLAVPIVIVAPIIPVLSKMPFVTDKPILMPVKLPGPFVTVK